MTDEAPLPCPWCGEVMERLDALLVIVHPGPRRSDCLLSSFMMEASAIPEWNRVCRLVEAGERAIHRMIEP